MNLPDLLQGGDETTRSTVFDNILGYVGHATDFLHLTKTCHDIRVYIKSNDDIWKLTPHYEEYKDDDRLPTAFEKAMVSKTIENIRKEQKRSHNSNIIMEELDLPKIISDTIYYVDTVFSCQPDSIRILAHLVEANVLRIMERVFLNAMQRADPKDVESSRIWDDEKEPYPTLEEWDFVYVLEALQRYGCNRLGGRKRIIDWALIPEIGRPTNRLTRRLANKVGIVKYTDRVYLHVDSLVGEMIGGILEYIRSCSMHCLGGNVLPPPVLQHPANIHMQKFPPKIPQNKRKYVLILPVMVERAAEHIGLEITKVYDDYSILSESDVAFDVSFHKYYSLLNEAEKQEYDQSVEDATTKGVVVLKEEFDKQMDEYVTEECDDDDSDSDEDDSDNDEEVEEEEEEELEEEATKDVEMELFDDESEEDMDDGILHWDGNCSVESDDDDDDSEEEEEEDRPSIDVDVDEDIDNSEDFQKYEALWRTHESFFKEKIATPQKKRKWYWNSEYEKECELVWSPKGKCYRMRIPKSKRQRKRMK